MPTAKELNIKKRKPTLNPLDLGDLTMEELDIMYLATDTDSPQRAQIANEIDKRVIQEYRKSGKGKKKKTMEKAEAYDVLGIQNPDLEKGKKMPVGTVSNGRKKVAEGKWVDVKKEGTKGSSSKDDKKKDKIRDEKDDTGHSGASKEAMKEKLVRAKSAWNAAHGDKEKQAKIAKDLDKIVDKLVEMKVIKKPTGKPFWRNKVHTG